MGSCGWYSASCTLLDLLWFPFCPARAIVTCVSLSHSGLFALLMCTSFFLCLHDLLSCHYFTLLPMVDRLCNFFFRKRVRFSLKDDYIQKNRCIKAWTRLNAWVAFHSQKLIVCMCVVWASLWIFFSFLLLLYTIWTSWKMETFIKKKGRGTWKYRV